MLAHLNSIQKYKIETPDGNVGNIHELLFDDQSWNIRYVVINTGNFVVPNLVLVQPEAFVSCNTFECKFVVNLTKEEILNSPSIETVKKTNYYWPNYWAGTHLTYGWTPFNAYAKKFYTEPNLNSTRELFDYKIKALDGKISFINNFIIDMKSWNIRNLIIDAGIPFLPGKKISIETDIVKNINAQQKVILLNINAHEMKNNPVYRGSKKLYKHVDRKPASLILNNQN